MDGPASAEVFRFEGLQFDRENRFLTREKGTSIAEFVPLGSRAAALLSVLLERSGELVTKDEIFAAVWPRMAVEEANLTVQISQLRRILDKDREQGSCIQTVPGRGYRFLAPVTKIVPAFRRVFASPDPDLQLPDQPSIAVLPFANLSGDPEQDYFADGMVEEIITALSRYPSLLVKSRNSSLVYKGAIVDVKQIGAELGVRYILHGGSRKSGNHIRVSAQLVDARTGNHLWADRYDGDLDDIFVVQDNITNAVTIAIAPAVAAAERQRAIGTPPESYGAWAAYQRGLWHFYKISREDNALAHLYFQHAIDIDPSFAGGYKGLAWAEIQAAGVLAIRTSIEAHSLAETLARNAIALHPNDAEARVTLSEAMLWSHGDYEGALAEAELARAMSPNLPLAHATLGAALIFSGRPKEGLAAVQESLRLDPLDPMLTNRLNTMTVGLYLAGDYEAAAAVARRAIRSNPDYPLNYRWLAAALGQLGPAADAKKGLQQAVAIAPASFNMYIERVPWHRLEDHTHMMDGLRKAGWKPVA